MTVATTGVRAELLRAIGAVALDPPPASDNLCDALGLDRMSGAEHTEAFVLLAPPHAAIHLGAEGKLGGEALDRVEGFWRALGVEAPREADHLGVLLLSYARLTEFDDDSAAHAARALLHEHILSWVPGYLDAVRSSCAPTVASWCELALDVIRFEAEQFDPPSDPPLALREAPAPLADEASLDDLLDAMVAPVRSGVVLTQLDVAAGAREIGVGFRRGERRFALKAMVEQDEHATLVWFAGLADAAARRHRLTYGTGVTGRWWTDRARATASVIAGLSKETS